MQGMLSLDGSYGEGGGQILRTSLALSLITSRPLRLTRIRAGRARPGLQRQHLTAVQAAAAVSQARVTGASLGSQELTFEPGPIQPGTHEIRIGSAGSTSLVLQTVLPALMLAGARSDLTLEGGTHNPFAPPFPFLAMSFLPLLERIGYRASISLERPGFYPVGGGRIRVAIEPAAEFRPLVLTGPAPVSRSLHAEVAYAALPPTIAERELAVLRERFPEAELRISELRQALGPGNAVWIIAHDDTVNAVFSAFGMRGVSAESVAHAAADQAAAFLASGARVEEHLADQLLLPMALAAGGEFTTPQPSSHTLTQIETLRHFLPEPPAITPSGPGLWTIRVPSPRPS